MTKTEALRRQDLRRRLRFDDQARQAIHRIYPRRGVHERSIIRHEIITMKELRGPNGSN